MLLWRRCGVVVVLTELGAAARFGALRLRALVLEVEVPSGASRAVVPRGYGGLDRGGGCRVPFRARACTCTRVRLPEPTPACMSCAPATLRPRRVMRARSVRVYRVVCVWVLRSGDL